MLRAVWYTVPAALLIWHSDAFGFYIDPGSGALLWQALLSAFFGALFFGRRFIQYVRTKLPWTQVVETEPTTHPEGGPPGDGKS